MAQQEDAIIFLFLREVSWRRYCRFVSSTDQHVKLTSEHLRWENIYSPEAQIWWWDISLKIDGSCYKGNILKNCNLLMSITNLWQECFVGDYRTWQGIRTLISERLSFDIWTPLRTCPDSRTQPPVISLRGLDFLWVHILVGIDTLA